MSIWHYSKCGCVADSDWQELDPEMEYCDKCLGEMMTDEIPERLHQILGLTNEDIEGAKP